MENEAVNGCLRSNITIGIEVEVIKKQHQQTGELTWGIVKGILTKAPKHHHGIKVILMTNEVGRVKNILT